MAKENPAGYKLRQFLKQDCQDLAQNIIKFSNYKPTKKNSEVLKKKSRSRKASKDSDDMNVE